ncbi:MAG TPA: hypothetical protein VMX18_01875 [Candidatus Bipolaricaulota bacterium]|nr:hypothetical protein [Candidatus Bipolaricaulota bacterium]
MLVIGYNRAAAGSAQAWCRECLKEDFDYIDERELRAQLDNGGINLPPGVDLVILAEWGREHRMLTPLVLEIHQAAIRQEIPLLVVSVNHNLDEPQPIRDRQGFRHLILPAYAALWAWAISRAVEAICDDREPISAIG